MLIKRLERAIARSAVNPVLQTWGHWQARSYDLSNTIILASSPRGGSTWLAEIVGTLPGYPLLYEPLNRNRNPECHRLGFTSVTYMPVDADADDATKKTYLYQVLTGANLSSRLASLSHFRPDHYLRFKGYLVKFIHANLLLYWMLHQFPIRAVFMVRHPCAVVSSQLQNPYWQYAHSRDWVNSMSEVISENLLRDYPHLLEVYRTVKTKEEGLAFIWAMQNYVPLNQPHPHPWYLMSYERLVMDGKREINRLFHYLKEAVPTQAYEQLTTPSRTTQAGSNVLSGKSRLSGWQEKLTPQQIDSILAIVHRVGIDFYSDALEPDYDRLFPLELPAGESAAIEVK